MESEREVSVDRLVRQQRTLAGFGLEAFRSTDLDALLTHACEQVSEGLDIRYVKALEALPGGGLFVRAGVNWGPGVVGTLVLGGGADSGGGQALATGEPVVSPDLSRETRFSVPPVLREHGIVSLANVVIPGEERPFGVLEVDAPERRDFVEQDITFLTSYANLLAAAIDRQRAHESLEEAVNAQRLLAQELAHRVKNMLGLVSSLAAQTAAEDPGARAFQQAFSGRLQALARAESLVIDESAPEVDLRRLVERSMEPFRSEPPGSIAIQGQHLRMPARHGRALALVLHELATNATKYGAFSAQGGAVRIAWTVEEADGSPRVRFAWRESGGPPADAPREGAEGFGTRLLTALAAYELDGSARLDYPAGGLEYTILFPVPAR